MTLKLWIHKHVIYINVNIYFVCCTIFDNPSCVYIANGYPALLGSSAIVPFTFNLLYDHTRARNLSHTGKQLWWSPSVNTIVAIRAVSGWFDTFAEPKNCSNLQSFGTALCHTRKGLRQQGIHLPRIAVWHIFAHRTDILTHIVHCTRALRAPEGKYVPPGV